MKNPAEPKTSLVEVEIRGTFRQSASRILTIDSLPYTVSGFGYLYSDIFQVFLVGLVTKCSWEV